MKEIKCKLFGQQKVEEDGNQIYLPPGKISGLFFYILINGKVSRDVAATLFWPDSDEKRAKTSLRNALHKIRNYIKSDIILSPNKADLSLNEDLVIKIDAKLLEESPIENYKYYEGEFLEGLYIDGLVDFDYWISEMREYYFKIYKNALERNLEKNYEEENLENYERDINLLISYDMFNEKAYYYKLLYYRKIERFDKVINEYHYYQNLINRELGISPPESLNNIYREAMSTVKENKEKNVKKQAAFFKREYELRLMENNFNKFLDNMAYESMLILGESGIGKTVLKEHFLNDNLKDLKIIRIQCNYLESNISYFPWIKIINIMDEYFKENNIKSPELWDEALQGLLLNSNNKYQPSSHILENTSNFSMDIIFNAILNAFKIYSEGKQLIIAIDDVHLIDKSSMDLLVRFILGCNKDIIFLLTALDEMDKNYSRTFHTLESLNKLLVIFLRRFTKKDVSAIVYSVLGDGVSKEDVEDIFKKSKGNAFFLNEYINIYSKKQSEEKLISKVDNILKEKFSMISEEEMTILRILSVSYEPLEMDMLVSSFKIEPFEVLRSIENLTKLKIIEEFNEGNKTKVGFTYSAYKKYIYNTLKESSKQILHLELANSLEKMVSDSYIDISIYNKLEKHFTKGGKIDKALKYKIYKLNYFLNFSHEVFPNINSYEAVSQVKKNIKNDRAIKLIDELEAEIITLKNNSIRVNQRDIIDEIEMTFLYCKGRYLIRCGKYDDGITVINRLIYLSQELENKKFELFGRKQLIIYGIQIDDQQIMIENIIPGIEIAKQIGNHLDIGVLYRLQGLYHLMVGDFNEAERLFNDSINIFSSSSILGNNNPISIAANYNYIGEIKTAMKEYDKAMKYYKKAISLSEESRPTCISIFYINAGITRFLLGDIESMKDYFNKADIIIKQFDSYWKKPVLDAFLGLIKFLDGDNEGALVYLQAAVSEVTTINNPRDMGIVYFVQALIAYASKDKPDIQKDRLLNESIEYYYYRAIKHLDPYRDKSQVQYLKDNIILGG